jgi:hypothetical protein
MVLPKHAEERRDAKDSAGNDPHAGKGAFVVPEHYVVVLRKEANPC